MEKILHEVDSIWKYYYIIQFPWNKYYARTNISSQFFKDLPITRVIIDFYDTVSEIKRESNCDEIFVLA
jgi:hypothetical protein